MRLSDTVTSQSLQRWHRGESEGLKVLPERHIDWVRDRVHRRLGSKLREKMETCDVVQDAAMQFLTYGPRFMMSDDHQFRSLLSRIVENVLRDKNDWFTARRREAARERPLPSDTVLSLDAPRKAMKTPDEIVERHEREAWVRLGMEFLEPADREVLVLRQWDSLSFEQAGDKLGITSDAARMRYSRAFGRLSDKVGALRRGEISEDVGRGLL